MKTRLLVLLSACALLFSVGQSAEAPKKKAAKSESEVAYSDWMKVVGDKTAKQDQAHFQSIVAAGFKLLIKYPASAEAVSVVRELGAYPFNYLKDKATAPQRGVYMSTLRYQVVSSKFEEGVTDEAKLAIAAVDAVAADADAKMQTSKANLQQLREKIDALAQMPGSGLFLAPREQAYAEILGFMSGPAKSEAYLKTLLEHPEKPVADMARRELDLLEFRKAPVELKFTALDGKEVDLAQLRGKIVALYFWSTGNPASTKGLDTIREVYSFNKKAGFEVVTVSYDKAEDRGKVTSHVRQYGVAWPVCFDGKGAKNEFGQKLGVSAAPRLVLIDRQGMLVSTNLPLNQLDGAVKQLAKAK